MNLMVHLIIQFCQWLEKYSSYWKYNAIQRPSGEFEATGVYISEDLFFGIKAFWRVRIEAAFALANTAYEDTDWAGLLHLLKFYRSRRFDANIGLPKLSEG